MATTSLSLGKHWEVFIKNEISSVSASEVVRDALRALEDRKSKLAAPRAHLAQGAQQTQNPNTIKKQTMLFIAEILAIREPVSITLANERRI